MPPKKKSQSKSHSKAQPKATEKVCDLCLQDIKDDADILQCEGKRTSSMPGQLPSSALKTLQMDLTVRCKTSFVCTICSVFSFWLLQKQRIKSQKSTVGQ